MLRDTLNKIRGWNRWSHSVEGYYPVDPQARWGYGKPANPHLVAALERDRGKYLQFLDNLEQQAERLHAISFPPGDVQKPYWNNSWFSTLDAASLVTIICSQRPRRYIEIGSGFSTRFASYAVRAAGLETSITSIDPHPRAEIDALCNKVCRVPLEACDLSLFNDLEAGDVLFFDGSHRTFTNSDVSVFFLEILPSLAPGVFVHIHDIFLPFDYPPAWSKRLYSEQYVLAAMLLAAEPGFEVILPCHYVAADPELRNLIRATFKSRSGGPDIPLHYINQGNTPPVSFWIRTRSNSP